LKFLRRYWVVIAAFAGAIFYIVSGAHSEGYKFLDQAIRRAPSIREQFGEVKTVTLSFTGGYRSKSVGDNEWVTMKLNVSGQKRTGTIAASAKRISGVWSVNDASMDGRSIDLQGVGNANYNPAAMVEVKNFADLPDGVQALANGSFMKERFDNTPTKFLVGGASKSSAIVAYEQFGYVPSFFAQSYVFSDSRWFAAKRWQLDRQIVQLSDLISSTSSAQP